MTAVTIPADLAADIARDVNAGGASREPWVRGICYPPDGGDLLAFDVDLDRGVIADDQSRPLRVLRIVLDVGSVDGGPRPEPGQRVLVLESLDGTIARNGMVVTVLRDHERTADPANGIMVTHRNDAGSSVTFWATRWALLPDKPAAEPETRYGGADCGLPTEPGGPYFVTVDTSPPRPPYGTPERAAHDAAAPTTTAPTTDAFNVWRVGGSIGSGGRNLWIGPPRDGVQVGRMDSPALAALVIDAVNRRAELQEHAAALRWQLAVMLGDVEEGDDPYAVNAETDELLDRVRDELDAARAGRDGWQRMADHYRAVLEDIGTYGGAMADKARAALGEQP